jgi:hypothetical protein
MILRSNESSGLQDDFENTKVLGCSVISVAFYYLCGYFSLLMPYWL